jgi:hypothetical protein
MGHAEDMKHTTDGVGWKARLIKRLAYKILNLWAEDSKIKSGILTM